MKWNVQARMVGQPFENLRVLVGGVVVEDSMDHLSGGDSALDGAEELDELLVAVVRHAAPNDRAVQYVERGEQCGRAIALVVVRHGPAFARLQRQAGLSAVERLDLALLIDRDDDRVRRRVHVEADDVLDLGGEGWVAGSLESSQTMGLEAMGAPDALNGTQRNAGGLGHRPSGPMGDGARRLRTGQGDDPRDNGLGDGAPCQVCGSCHEADRRRLPQQSVVANARPRGD